MLIALRMAFRTVQCTVVDELIAINVEYKIYLDLILSLLRYKSNKMRRAKSKMMREMKSRKIMIAIGSASQSKNKRGRLGKKFFDQFILLL